MGLIIDGRGIERGEREGKRKSKVNVLWHIAFKVKFNWVGGKKGITESWLDPLDLLNI